MATAGESDGSRRRKRPWRQPRHSAGGGTGSTTSAPSGPLAAASDLRSDIAAANESGICSSAETGTEVKESRSVSEKQKEREKERTAEVKTESAGEQQGHAGGGEERSRTDGETDGREVGVAAAGVVEIDGSVMEGVSFCCTANSLAV